MRTEMPTNIRLTKDEQRDIEVKCRELNKILINQEFAPIQESELVHIVLKRAINRLSVDKRGEIDID